MNARTLAVLAVAALSHASASAQVIAVGIDTKFAFDDKGGRAFYKPSRGQVMFFDLKHPAHPVPIGSLPLTNSVVGPPSNIAITQDQRLVLVANSLQTEAVPDGG